MAAKKNPVSRLGSDPLSWIRDTRPEQEETPPEPTSADMPQPEPEPAPQETRPPAVQPETKPAKSKAQPKPKAERTSSKASVKAPTPQEEQAPNPPVASAQANDAVSLTKAVLSPEELKALALLLEEAKGPAKRGRPRTNFREITKSSQEGLPENWTRATFIVREDHLQTLKDYAYTQRMTIRDALDEALEQYLADKKVIARRVRGE